ncbi:hypothetical protein SBADM41S_02883 [Streptomyces badius]
MSDRAVQIQGAPVDEDERRETGEGFRGRPHAHQRVPVPRNGPRFVRVATPQIDFHDPVHIDGDRRPQLLAGFEARRQRRAYRLEPVSARSLDTHVLLHS